MTLDATHKNFTVRSKEENKAESHDLFDDAHNITGTYDSDEQWYWVNNIPLHIFSRLSRKTLYNCRLSDSKMFCYPPK